MSRFTYALLALWFAISFSVSAHAAQYRITYTGSVTIGRDNGGIFTAPGTDLSGFSYIDQFILDTGVGATSFDNGLYSTIDGINMASPLKASLTINGRTFQFGNKPLTHGSAGQSNFFDGTNHALYDEVTHFVQDFDNGAYFNYDFNRITSFDNNIVNSSSYTANLFYVVQPLDRLDGNFSICEGCTSSITASGNLKPQTVRIEGLAASVPEPKSWAMMLVGFGAVGASVRSRRFAAISRFA